MNVVEQAEQAGVHIRPLVRKHYPYFLECVKQHGGEIVKNVLQKGKYSKYRLTFLKNKKDRYQMMQLLDLI